MYWGPDIPNPITISTSWEVLSGPDIPGSFGAAAASPQLWARIFNLLLFVANLVSYGLDSIPLANACLRAKHGPLAEVDWTCVGWCRYLVVSLPSWAFGFVASVFMPSLFDMLAFVTALTTPWATQIFPAVVFLHHLNTTEGNNGATVSGIDRVMGRFVLFVGVINFGLCIFGAIGQVSIESLRGDAVVGCSGWMLIDQSS